MSIKTEEIENHLFLVDSISERDTIGRSDEECNFNDAGYQLSVVNLLQ